MIWGIPRNGSHRNKGRLLVEEKLEKTTSVWDCSGLFLKDRCSWLIELLLVRDGMQCLSSVGMW